MAKRSLLSRCPSFLYLLNWYCVCFNSHKTALLYYRCIINYRRLCSCKILNRFTTEMISNIFSIIGDTHLRDSARRINQYLNSKYEATGIIKPGATTQTIVTPGENELKSLRKKDMIVLNCGANNIEKVNSNISTIITPVINFSQKYSDTNIIVLEIPHRHDLHHKYMTNLLMQSLNTKLKSILTRFRHVTILHMNTTRNHFTKHGLHINKPGRNGLLGKLPLKLAK